MYTTDCLPVHWHILQKGKFSLLTSSCEVTKSCHFILRPFHCAPSPHLLGPQTQQAGCSPPHPPYIFLLTHSHSHFPLHTSLVHFIALQVLTCLAPRCSRQAATRPALGEQLV